MVKKVKKKLVVKDSVKSVLIITALFLVVIVGSITLGNRLNNLEQKKTEMHTQISQNK
jgi:hypothetical protein